MNIQQKVKAAPRQSNNGWISSVRRNQTLHVSQPFDYPRSVRLSCSADDFDPLKVLVTLASSKFNHSKFDPALFSDEHLQQVQLILNR
jgi:hypothetical protein